MSILLSGLVAYVVGSSHVGRRAFGSIATWGPRPTMSRKLRRKAPPCPWAPFGSSSSRTIDDTVMLCELPAEPAKHVEPICEAQIEFIYRVTSEIQIVQETRQLVIAHRRHLTSPPLAAHQVWYSNLLKPQPKVTDSCAARIIQSYFPVSRAKVICPA